MHIYLLTSLSLVFFGLIYESINSVTVTKYKKTTPIFFFTVPSFILLFIISTFRGDFTTDYKNYTNLFYLYNKFSFSELLNDRFVNEIGFIYSNKIIGQFTDNAVFIFAFMSFIILFGYFYHIKKYSNNVWLSVLMFATVGSYYASFNISRHIFAVAIIFWGSEFLYERKFIKWILVVII